MIFLNLQEDFESKDSLFIIYLKLDNIEFTIDHRGSHHFFFYGYVKTFELFAAKAKWARFNHKMCRLVRAQEKIIASLSVYLTLP